MLIKSGLALVRVLGADQNINGFSGGKHCNNGRKSLYLSFSIFSKELALDNDHNVVPTVPLFRLHFF